MFDKRICFDIGESQIKLAYFSGKKLVKTLNFRLPEGMVVKGEIADVDALADLIKLKAKENGVPGGEAALVLPSALVITRNLTLAAMTDKQLRFNLPFEFKGYLPKEREDYYYDYAVLGTNTDEDGKVAELNLFACAVLKETIDRYRDMLKKAGYKLKLAVPDEWVISPLIRSFYKRSGDEVKDIALVDIGRNNTRIRILSEGFPSTKRTSDIGMVKIEEELSKMKGISIEAAHEMIKQNTDPFLTTKEGMALYSMLATEVTRVVNFYNYNVREKSIDRICIAGGGAAIKPVRNAMVESTGLKEISLTELAEELAEVEAPWLFFNAVACAHNAKEAK